ncbi:MAG: tetratricopeptide repeat protein [bacterium]|nr:tetratricopeptide repeat protein [bacterium]
MKTLLVLLFFAGPAVAEAVPGDSGGVEEAVRRFYAEDFESAEDLLLAAREQQPKSAEIAYYLGRVHLERGRHKDAVAEIERATRLDPASSTYQFWLGEALVERIDEVGFLFKLSVAKRMRAAYEKAVELDPDNLEARVAVARYHSEAPAIAGGDRARADAEIEAIRERDPALAHVTLALIHEQLDRIEPATLELEIAVVVDPESVQSWREAGFFYQRLERWHDARRAFEEVLARAPDDRAALYESARTAIAISDEQLRRAQRALEAYLEQEPGPGPVLLNEATPPSRAAAHHELGRVHERRGRPDLAAPRYRAAVALNAGDETARDALARVRGDCPLESEPD